MKKSRGRQCEGKEKVDGGDCDGGAREKGRDL